MSMSIFPPATGCSLLPRMAMSDVFMAPLLGSGRGGVRSVELKLWMYTWGGRADGKWSGMG